MAQNPSQRSPIVLTDQWVECSRVVKRVLDIIYTLDVGDLDESNTNTLLYALDFAKKWDIFLISELMIKDIGMATTFPQCPAFELLQLSLKLDHNDLAKAVFAAECRDSWSRPSDQVFYSEMASLDGEGDLELPANYQSENVISFSSQNSYVGDIFDFGSMPHQCFIQLPPTVIWIILRAKHMAAHDKSITEQERFGELIDVACEYES